MIVIPVYNMILTPDATVYCQTEQLRRSAGSKGITVGERVILIVARENQSFRDLTEESFYPIGVAGTISGKSARGRPEAAISPSSYRRAARS